MYKHKFEYFLNAVHYCMWLFERKFGFFIGKIVDFFISPIPKFLFTKKMKKRYYDNMRKSQPQLDELFYGKKSGFSIGLAHHNFGAFYSIYPCIFSFVIEGLFIKCNVEMNTFVILVIFAIPVGICYIPAYKAVFSNDKYLQYFKQFEKEDEHWHKKWKRRTIAFIFGAIASLFLGVIIIAVIVTS